LFGLARVEKTFRRSAAIGGWTAWCLGAVAHAQPLTPTTASRRSTRGSASIFLPAQSQARCTRSGKVIVLGHMADYALDIRRRARRPGAGLRTQRLGIAKLGSTFFEIPDVNSSQNLTVNLRSNFYGLFVNMRICLLG